jgi:hypothetical protein
MSPEPILCGLAYTGENASRWTWYIGETFGRDLELRRAKALDRFDLALRAALADGSLEPGWVLGNDVNLKAWLAARRRSDEYPAPRGESKPKPQRQTRGGR